MKGFKTRQAIAAELGISRRTFYNKLKQLGICLPPGDVSPKDQALIYEKFGVTPPRPTKSLGVLLAHIFPYLPRLHIDLYRVKP